MIFGKKQRNPQGPKPLVWRGKRNCERCTRWRPVSDFTVYKTRTGYEQIKGECEVCKREREKQRYNKLTPEQRSARGKKANKQAQQRRDDALEFIARQRKILDQQNHKIEKLSDKIERHRKISPIPRKSINGYPAVDITPFRMWLLRKHRENEYNTRDLAIKMGFDESRLRHWMDGYQWNGAGRDPVPIRSVSIAVVDQAGIKMDDGGLLERLYPLETDVDV